MRDGIRFSMSDLPPRYQAQVAQQLNGKRMINSPSPTNPIPPKAKPKKVRSPICMVKKGEGPNKTEAQFNREMLLGKGKYEAITLHLPGGVKYRPDWLFENDGEIYCVEVKGNYHLPTHGRSVMAFKTACAQFPMFSFIFAELGKDGKTWTIGAYKNGEERSTVKGTAQNLQEIG